MPWKWRPKKPFLLISSNLRPPDLFIFPCTQSRITYHFCLYIILQPWKGLVMLRGWWFRFLPILLKLYLFGIQNKIHHIFWQYGVKKPFFMEFDLKWKHTSCLLKVQRVHLIFQQMGGFFCSNNQSLSMCQFYVTFISFIERMQIF